MDEWLAQTYGTNGSGQSDDLEKTAQAMMLQKLAEEEGIDLSGLSDEELDTLAQTIVSEDGEEQGGEMEQAAPGEGSEEEMQAKFAEADFLGRVMAHAYTQEINKIAQAAEEGAEEEEKKPAPPFPPAMKKEEKKEEEKEKTGALTRAIERLGGTVGGADNASAYVEKLAEARAEELAIGWLTENGYIK